MKKASTILMLVAAAAWSCSQETPLGVDTDVSASRSGREVKMVPFAGHHHALVVDASGVSCPAGQTAGRSTIPEGEKPPTSAGSRVG